MRLAVVLERPTQFDVPLFRHAAQDRAHSLRVLYTDPLSSSQAYDPELGRDVGWGSDLLAGYDGAASPPRGRNGWLRRELAAGHDLVIVNGYTRRPYLTATAAARRAGSSTALRLDSVLFDEGPGPRRTAKRLLFRLVVRRLFHLFLGVGTATREYLEALGLSAGRIGRFPYPVDVAGLRGRALLDDEQRDLSRAGLGVPAGDPAVLAVAKLHPRETPWDLLEAWPQVAAPNRWLLVAGDGPDRAAVEAFVAERRLPRVKLLGYVPYPDLPALFSCADLFVHAPRQERWGVSVGESLACDRPVVASDRVGAARDLVRSGENGFVYPARDLEALAARIGEALHIAPAAVRSASEAPLGAWGLAATWQGLLEAAARRAGNQRT